MKRRSSTAKSSATTAAATTSNIEEGSRQTPRMNILRGKRSRARSIGQCVLAPPGLAVARILPYHQMELLLRFFSSVTLLPFSPRLCRVTSST